MKIEVRKFLFFVEMVLIPTFINLISAQSSSVNDLALKIPPRPEISGGAAMILSKVKGSAQQISDVEVPLIPDFLGYLSPNILVSFDAINFDGDHTNTAHYHIPPDPIGAAGLNHVVNVVNTSIEWYTKTGSNQNSQSLSEFFSSLAPLTDNTFDPKVIYDQYADRFVAVALEMTDTTSRIMLAVSDDSDPNGTWHYHAINSKLIADGDTAWADYPGFAVDEEAIYVTANMFTFDSLLYRDTFLWIVNKELGSGGFYDGGPASVANYDPYDIVDELDFAQTTQPAHMFGTAPSGVGTFLVSYQGLTDGTNEYVQIIRVNDPLGAPSFHHQFVSVGNIENASVNPLPDAPQMTSTHTIEVNDRRLLNAVWRNNSLWAVTQILPASGPDMNQTTAHWWKLNTSNLNDITVADQGNVGGEDIATGTFTFFPSVAVNMNGDMAIGFSASAPTIFSGGYYTGRLAGDQAGMVHQSSTLRAGVDYYYRAFGGSRNRWGDYSGMSVDPSDDLTFWVFNEYAITRGTPSGGEDGRWGTAWGSFTADPVSVNESENLLYDFYLYQNYPNPFNPTTNIKFQISDHRFVELRIFDITGRLVQTLLSEIKAPGSYDVQWNGKDSYGKKVSSGAFFYQLKAGDFVRTKKMLLIR
jgi:hypothetical protein